MMRSLSKAALRIRSLVARSRVEQELNDELRFHLEMLIEQKRAHGMTEEEARYTALRDLGGIEQVKEQCRETRSVGLVEDIGRDVRFGLRMMIKNLGFTAVAVLTLALGIGANTAVFSLVDAVLIRPLPYRNPGELALVSETLPQMAGETDVGMAAGEYLHYQDRNRSFVQTAAYEPAGFNLTGEGTPLRINAASVTASLFPLLGVAPLLGCTFSPDEEHPGSDSVAVLSYSLWQSHYGANPVSWDRGSSWTRNLISSSGSCLRRFTSPQTAPHSRKGRISGYRRSSPLIASRIVCVSLESVSSDA